GRRTVRQSQSIFSVRVRGALIGRGRPGPSRRRRRGRSRLLRRRRRGGRLRGRSWLGCRSWGWWEGSSARRRGRGGTRGRPCEGGCVGPAAECVVWYQPVDVAFA